MARKGDQQWK